MPPPPHCVYSAGQDIPAESSPRLRYFPHGRPLRRVNPRLAAGLVSVGFVQPACCESDAGWAPGARRLGPPEMPMGARLELRSQGMELRSQGIMLLHKLARYLDRAIFGAIAPRTMEYFVDKAIVNQIDSRRRNHHNLALPETSTAVKALSKASRRRPSQPAAQRKTALAAQRKTAAKHLMPVAGVGQRPPSLLIWRWQGTGKTTTGPVTVSFHSLSQVVRLARR